MIGQFWFTVLPIEAIVPPVVPVYVPIPVPGLYDGLEILTSQICQLVSTNEKDE